VRQRSSETHVYCDKYVEIPGWYRPEKKWDLLIVADGRLLAESSSNRKWAPSEQLQQRTEESIGSAVDLWAAYREGAFKPSARPWLGYLMLLEGPWLNDSGPGPRAALKVFPEFKTRRTRSVTRCY